MNISKLQHLLLFLGSSCQSEVTTTPAPTKKRVTDVRLPLSLDPVYYDVELQPFMYGGNPGAFSFRGFVRIVLKCLTATDNVTLHINKLNIANDTIRFSAESPTSSDPVYTSWTEDKVRQFMIVHLDRAMTAGQNYVLQMNFTGPLTDDLHGLYLSSYPRGNQTVYLASTQFQPTDARKAFPCFDEPAIKSHFNITLIRPSHLTSLSNTPIRDSSRTWSEGGIDWVADVYETTPKMSTYLLAFVVSDFVSLSATTANNVTYRVWARPESISQAQYALDVGVEVLTYFENYYQIPYPLPKQDMIAIPDFAAGAMENWGLITYRETAMLYQPGVSSEGDKQRVAVVVSHELAHQWFGDLVTPSWWDDLWLNEGFASYMEYVGVDVVHPDWKMFDQYIIEDVQDVFDFDSLVTSHPVYVPVSHPDEINEIFDRISYAKGASIIGMMKHFLGEQTFKTGLTNYLNQRSYDAAFHDDLWTAMTAQAQRDGKNLDVKAIMDTWTLQMNFPYVTVTREGADSIKVTQARFLRDPNAVDTGKYKSPFGYKWDIPITFTSSRELKFDKTDADVSWLWRSSPERVIPAEGLLPPEGDTDGWVLANVKQHGYYRVNYEESNWRALCKQLATDHTVIPQVNRAQIMNDAWNLARGDYLSMDIALLTVEYLHQEMDYIPWHEAQKELDFVDKMLSRTALYGDFQKFMLSKVQGPFRAIGMNNTGASHLQSYLRSILAYIACQYDDPDCVGNSTALFKQWMDQPDTNPIDAGLKATVYCTAIRVGGVEEWDFAYQQYKMADVAAEKARLQRSLACSQKIWILGRYLNLALTPSEIRKQDALKVIQSISLNTLGRGLAWDLFRGKWDTIRSEYGQSFFSFTSLIGTLTKSFNTEFQLQQLQEFMRTHPNQGSGTRAFQQAVEKTRSNIAWMKQHYNTLADWLERQNP
ncbi:hypothetical protein BaRGS_00010994 [Batillaria attramentaria]|uniref:Aminopeptidase n=1 Tax=Batillaria attramentaria TaxID=370345 RepID=A0ABD0LET4_9CAEN